MRSHPDVIIGLFLDPILDSQLICRLLYTLIHICGHFSGEYLFAQLSHIVDVFS